MTERGGNEIRVVGPGDVDPVELSTLLDEALGPVSSRFLEEHGGWWHRGPGHRLVALCDGVVAGYRGFVPSVIQVKDREVPAIWAMHLYVAPRFRGRGLQRALDQRLIDEAELRMSFPNATGAGIYAKQGYGLREDLQVLRLPLRPRFLQAVRAARVGRKRLLPAGALAVSPLASAYRAYALRYKPTRTEIVTSPDVRVLETVFRMYAARYPATTLRSAEHLRWRYFDAPHRSEFVFFLTTLRERPTHYGIVRYFAFDDLTRARILDIFGDPDDSEGLADLLRTVIRDAIGRESVYVSTIASSPGLAAAARSAGFLLSKGLRFRWRADDLAIHRELGLNKPYWTLGDGENDLPS
jgi:GNAT superfamily N-acetyltransferase